MTQNRNHMTPPMGRPRHNYKPGRTEYHPTAQAAADLPVILEAFDKLPPEERAQLLRISERLRDLQGLEIAGLIELLYRLGELLAADAKDSAAQNSPNEL